MSFGYADDGFHPLGVKRKMVTGLLAEIQIYLFFSLITLVSTVLLVQIRMLSQVLHVGKFLTLLPYLFDAMKNEITASCRYHQVVHQHLACHNKKP